MNKPAKLLVFAQLTASGCLAASAAAVHWPALDQLLGLAAFAGLAAFSERLATDFSVGPQRRVQSSIAFIPLFACALVFPLWYILAVVALVSTASEVQRKATRVPWLFALNVSQYLFSYGLAATVYGLFSPGRTFAQMSYLGFSVMALTFFTSNLILVSVALRFWKGIPILVTLKQAVGPSGGNILFDALSAPVAVLGAFVYVYYGAGPLLFVALPLLFVRYSYASKLKLERVNKDILTVLVKAIETRDPHTSGHSIRVATLARWIARDLGLRRWAVDEIERAALLHDIGKIEALYAPVISKPYSLTPEERVLIKSHPTKGADLLLELSAFTASLIKAVRHHHERFDGTGYPDGLMGEGIPLAARIIMICDSIDAMLSDRPYRRALPVAAVEEELRACAGTQFDPSIVAIVLANDTVKRASLSVASAHEMMLTAAVG